MLLLAGPATAVSAEHDSAQADGTIVPRGYDVSYPQCARLLPSKPAFAIVGVNGGKAFSVNPCLAAEIAWGGGPSASLYVNTGNPGPAKSTFWPRNQLWPRTCDPANLDTADCAYDYGWNAAVQSFQTAVDAYASLGITVTPAATAWWLDVETSNSWRSDNLDFNVAALLGEVDSLRFAGVIRIGLYSTRYQWNKITGGSLAFSRAPSWLAGGGSLKGAQRLCTRRGFTGGPTVLVQYLAFRFDADLACSPA